MTDTTPEALAIQTEILRKMTGEQRMLLAFEMTELAREFARARLRKEHPDWSEADIKQELIRIAFLPNELPPDAKCPGVKK